MKQYKVKFEIYGKKMQTSVVASDPVSARTIIMQKIIFHDVTEEQIEKQSDDDAVNQLLNMFGMKK